MRKLSRVLEYTAYFQRIMSNGVTRQGGGQFLAFTGVTGHRQKQIWGLSEHILDMKWDTLNKSLS